MAAGITAQQLMVEVGADTSEADRKLNNLGDTSGGAGWTKGLAKAGVAAFAAVGVAAAGVIGYGVKIAAENEQAQISFTTMLGSGEKAKAFLTDLKAFAAKTPFEFPELQTAASSLVSAGFEASKVIPIMTTLGNVTSGMGTGSEGVQRATVALQQMSAAGRITGEDLNQLRDAGIPVFDLLAGATGKSKEEIAAMAQAGKLGKVEMQAMFDALEKGGAGLERFDGLMEKQSQSLTGLIATVKDTAGQALATVAEPLVKGLKDALPDLTKTLDEVFTTIGPTLSETVSSLLGVIKSLLPAVAPILKVFGGALAKTLDSLAPIIEKAGPDIEKLALAFGKVLEAVLPVLPALLDVAVKLLPPITVLATLLASLLTAIPVPVMTALVAAFVLFSQVLPVVAGALAFLVSPIGLVVAAIVGLVLIAKVVMDHWEGIAGFFTGLWDRVSGIFTGAIAKVGEHAGTIGRVILFALTGGMSEVVLFFIRNWDKIKSGVTDAFGAVVSWFQGLPGKILSAIGDLGNLLKDVGGKIIDGLIKGIKAGFGKVKDTLGDLTGKLVSWKGPERVDRKLLYGAGGVIIDGLVAGLESRYGAVHASLAALTESMTVGGNVTAAIGTRAVTSLGLTSNPVAPTAGYAANAAAAAAGGAGMQVVVQGSLWSLHDLADELRPILIRTGGDLGGVLFDDPNT